MCLHCFKVTVNKIYFIEGAGIISRKMAAGVEWLLVFFSKSKLGKPLPGLHYLLTHVKTDSCKRIMGLHPDATAPIPDGIYPRSTHFETVKLRSHNPMGLACMREAGSVLGVVNLATLAVRASLNKAACIITTSADVGLARNILAGRPTVRGVDPKLRIKFAKDATELEQTIGIELSTHEKQLVNLEIFGRAPDFAYAPNQLTFSRFVTGAVTVRPEDDNDEDEDEDEDDDEDEMLMELARNASLAEEEAGRERALKRQRRQPIPCEFLLKTAEALDDDAPRDEFCCVCWVNRRTVLLIDATGHCNHKCLCDDCAKEIMASTKECPICRQPAVSLRRPI